MSAIINDTPTPQELTSADSNIEQEQYGAHLLLKAADARAEIKSEPPEDIDDTPKYFDENDVGFVKSEPPETPDITLPKFEDVDSPLIRLTPTSKLLATPKTVDPKRKFACPYETCTKSYGKSSHLRSHLTWHTGIKPFVCQEMNCGKGFTRSDELNRHVRTHTGEKPFECVQCTKKFSRSDHLTKHLATHAKQMSNSMNPLKINSTPKRMGVLDDQTLRKRKLPGTPSNGHHDSPTKKVFTEMQNPAEHMHFSDGMHFMAALVQSAADAAEAEAAIAQMKQEPENLAEEPKNVQMPIKIKLERPDQSNDYHVVQPPMPHVTPHITASESEDDSLPPYEMIVPVSTMICPASPEAQPSEIKIEPTIEPKVEPKTEPKPEPSDDTIMPEANAVALGMAHFGKFIAEVAYDPTRPFACNQCDKSFKRQDDLNRHVRTHTGEKPYVCGECDRPFMRSDHLKKHMKTHTRIQQPLIQGVPQAIPQTAPQVIPQSIPQVIPQSVPQVPTPCWPQQF